MTARNPDQAATGKWLPVGIYTRVSTNKQLGRRVESCESQEAICLDFVQAQLATKGWKHVQTFTDPGYSGATMKRPGMEALKRSVAAGEIKVVVIFKLERVLRSTDEWAPFRSFLAGHRCELVSAMEDISEKTALGRLKNNLLVSVSEYDRLNIAEKVRAKMGEQAKRGLWNGGSVPYGYAYDKNTQELAPHPEEAAVVRRIYEQASQLVPLTTLANLLNDEGFRTKKRFLRRRDGTREVVGLQRFRSDGLRLLITNPIYRGVVRFSGNEYNGQHDSLVSDEIWNQANAAVRVIGPRPEIRVERNRHHYVLKGLCRCGHCGRAMIPQTCGMSNNAGKKYRYYNCGAVMRDRDGAQCPVGRLSANALEGAVMAFLGQVSNHPDMVAGVLSKLRTRNQVERRSLKDDLATLQTRIDQLNSELDRCVDIVVKGKTGVLEPELLKRAETLRNDHDGLLIERERKRQELMIHDSVAFNKKRVQDSLERLTLILPKLQPDERAELVRLFIDRVEIQRPDRTRFDETLGESHRILALRIKLHLPRLVEGIEQTANKVPANRHRPIDVGGVNFDASIDFPRAGNGVVTILSPFNHRVAVSMQGSNTLLEKPLGKINEPQHLVVRAQHWQRLLESGQVINRVALANRVGVTPGAVTRTLKLIKLVPEIQNFLGSLATKESIRHFGLTKVARLSDLNREDQLVAFERIRRAFSQKTPDLLLGKTVKNFRSSATRNSDSTDVERIIQLLRRSGPIAPRQIAAELELSRAATYRHLTALSGDGTVQRAGSTKACTYAIKTT